MIQVKFSLNPYIKGSTGQVAVKVRWNNSRYEASFFTSVWADPNKWDSDLRRAKKGTTHEVRGMKYTFAEINEAIATLKEEITSIFEKCALKNTVPSVEELKQMVNSALGRGTGVGDEALEKKKTMKEMIDWFLDERGREKNWDDQAKEKYTQAFLHITSSL